MTTSYADRFWAKVSIGDPADCWTWTAAIGGTGYGFFWLAGRVHPAHRVSYELACGEIPEGATIDHLCRNRRCVNPAHLEPVSHGDNVMRGISFAAQNARKTHCPAGHPYDSRNTYINGAGDRICRACNRERARKWRQSRRG